MRPDPPPGQPGHHHADAPVRRGHRAGVVPHALAGSGQGGPRGRDVPGDPGRRVPAVRRGLLARAGGLLAVAVHAPRVRRGTPRDPGRVRGGAGGLPVLAVRPAHGRRAGPGPDPGVVPGPRRRPADLRHRPAHRGGDRQPGVRRAVQPGPAGQRRGQRARGAGVRRARHRPRRDRRSGAGGGRRRAAAGVAAPRCAHGVTSSVTSPPGPDSGPPGPAPARRAGAGTGWPARRTSGPCGPAGGRNHPRPTRRPR